MERTTPLGNLGQSLQLDRPMSRGRALVVPPPPVPEARATAFVQLQDHATFEGHFFLSDNAIETELAPQLTPQEYVVYRRLWFESFGAMGGREGRRNYCRVSYDYLVRSTSLKSKTGVINALKGLMQKGCILRMESDDLQHLGSVYRVLRPAEIRTRTLAEGIPLADLEGKLILPRTTGNGNAMPSHAIPSETIAHDDIASSARTLQRDLPRTLSQQPSIRKHENGISSQHPDPPGSPLIPSASLRGQEKNQQKNKNFRNLHETHQVTPPLGTIASQVPAPTTPQELLTQCYQAAGRAIPLRWTNDEWSWVQQLVFEYDSHFLTILYDEYCKALQQFPPSTPVVDQLRAAFPFVRGKLQRHGERPPLPHPPHQTVAAPAASPIDGLSLEEFRDLLDQRRKELFRMQPASRSWAPEILERTLLTQIRREVLLRVRQDGDETGYSSKRR